jgi:hypothetical protein
VTMAVTTSRMPSTAFYSVCDSGFFLGVVALVNSLRLVGHEEPIFIVDAGLTPEQKRAMSDQATIIDAPEGDHAVFLTPYGPLERPAEVSVLLDADIVVLRPLSELIEAARPGRLVAFVNNEPNHDRFFTEWGSALDLGSLQQRSYLAAGQLFVPEALGRRLLPLWSDRLSKISLARTRYGRARLSDPFYFADMDVFNAIMSAAFGSDEILMLEHVLAPHPPFPDLRLVDGLRLVCRYPDGRQPFLLHHILAKPWARATRSNLYSLLLPRLLLGPDVALPLEPQQLPLRLREGWLAAADRVRADTQALVCTNARRQLGRFGIRTRLANARRRRAAKRG